MAARQVAIDRAGMQEGRQRHAAPTAAETAAKGVAAAEAAALPAAWKPSRFFEAWKKEFAKRAGFEVSWSSMAYHRDYTPEGRRHAIDSILRATITSQAYDSDDFYEGAAAANNDHGAMQAYAGAFVDAVWMDLWSGYREPRPVVGTGGGADAAR